MIGQGSRPKVVSIRSWGGSDPQAHEDIPRAVTLRGGEYFFMPSLAFLAAL